MKKIVAILLSACLIPITFADTCPTVAAIQQNNLSGWKAFDVDDGTPLSQKRYDQFKVSVKRFALAEWNPQKGIMHCFYTTADGSGLDAYLAKGKIKLGNNGQIWYEVSGAVHCAASLEKCQFQAMQASEPHFAERDQAKQAVD